MGWHRKDESCRVYKEKAKDGGYVLVILENGRNSAGDYDAVANAMVGSNPSLASTSVNALFLLNRSKRVQWSDLPEEWQKAFTNWLEIDPYTTKGFWKVGNMPRHRPIPADHPVQPFRAGVDEATVDERTGRTSVMTCASCGLSWDDNKVTSMTPVPAARCPFEAFHLD